MALTGNPITLDYLCADMKAELHSIVLSLLIRKILGGSRYTCVSHLFSEQCTENLLLLVLPDTSSTLWTWR